MGKKEYGKSGKPKAVFAVLIAAFWIAFSMLFLLSFAEKRLYPLYYEREIIAAANEYGIEPALVFAIVNTESGFDAQAVSAKGAAGLMQILPSTGRYIADRRGIGAYDLFEPTVNLDFGCYYWRYLSERFGGLTERAAAYNAGEGTVQNWLKNAEYSADGERLDVIPYSETETYVKKIFESLKRYRKLYGKLLDK